MKLICNSCREKLDPNIGFEIVENEGDKVCDICGIEKYFLRTIADMTYRRLLEVIEYKKFLSLSVIR